MNSRTSFHSEEWWRQPTSHAEPSLWLRPEQTDASPHTPTLAGVANCENLTTIFDVSSSYQNPPAATITAPQPPEQRHMGNLKRTCVQVSRQPRCWVAVMIAVSRCPAPPGGGHLVATSLGDRSEVQNPIPRQCLDDVMGTRHSSTKR